MMPWIHFITATKNCIVLKKLPTLYAHYASFKYSIVDCVAAAFNGRMQKRINMDATTRFWDLYLLALLLFSIEHRESGDLVGIIGEMEVLLKEFESETNGIDRDCLR